MDFYVKIKSIYNKPIEHNHLNLCVNLKYSSNTNSIAYLFKSIIIDDNKYNLKQDKRKILNYILKTLNSNINYNNKKKKTQGIYTKSKIININGQKNYNSFDHLYYYHQYLNIRNNNINLISNNNTYFNYLIKYLLMMYLNILLNKSKKNKRYYIKKRKSINNKLLDYFLFKNHKISMIYLENLLNVFFLFNTYNDFFFIKKKNHYHFNLISSKLYKKNKSNFDNIKSSLNLFYYKNYFNNSYNNLDHIFNYFNNILNYYYNLLFFSKYKKKKINSIRLKYINKLLNLINIFKNNKMKIYNNLIKLLYYVLVSRTINEKKINVEIQKIIILYYLNVKEYDL